uniref:Ndwfamide 2 n=1 Tax=Deroceras reticulatum TaxID=145610 RepID=A0A1X9WEE7_DERRE|nr:ndwfamide 2 [Deroceras reticulatum]
MSRMYALALTAVFVVVFTCSQTEANWFGKRGNRNDLFDLIIRQPRIDRTSELKQTWEEEPALLAVEVWGHHQQHADAMAKSTQE